MLGEKNILIGSTGSVATIKLPLLVNLLFSSNKNINVKVITTERAKHFLDINDLHSDVKVYEEKDEWDAWGKRGDSVLHIDLGKWADLMIISPLSANSLAKISSGVCDNLLLSVIRAWDRTKPLFFCPAMNTRMYNHPITSEQIDKLKSWGYIEIPCISKTLMCGDTGFGAMANIDTIVNIVIDKLKEK